MADIKLDSIRIDVELSPGVWTNLIADVVMDDSITSALGITGFGPTDLVGGTGTLAFTLDNSALAGLLGRYSPGHANLLAGWAVQDRVRFVLSYSTGNAAIYDEFLYNEQPYGGEYYKYGGRIRSITPTAGQFQDRKVAVGCTDWLDDAANQKTSRLVVDFDVMSGEAVNTLLDSVVNQPQGRDLAVGIEVFPTVFDTAKDERTLVLGELQKVVVSEFGRLYTKGDQSSGEVLTFEDRRQRLLIKTASQTLNETDLMEVTPTHDVSSVYNVVRVTSYPRLVGDTPTALFTLRNPISLVPGQSHTFQARYTDEANPDARVAGTDMVTPEAGTHYKFSKSKDNDNGDLNEDLTVMVTFGGNAAECTVTNDGQTPGFVTTFKLVGTSIKTYEPVVAEARNNASIALYGERILDISMPYLDNSLLAEALAVYVLRLYAYPRTFYTVGIQTHGADESLLIAALQVEPGDVVDLTEQITALSGLFVVNAVRVTIDTYWMPYVVWTVLPVDPTDYWLLETVNYGELEQETYLGP